MKKTGEQIANEMNKATTREEVRKIAGEYAEERRQAVAEIREKYENSDSPIASTMLERAEKEEKRARVLEAVSRNDRKAYEEAAAGASGTLLQDFHGYAISGLDEEEETTEERKTTAQRFAEKCAEREAFEVFEGVYFEAHPTTATRFKNYARRVEGLEELAKQVRRTLEAVQRHDERAAVGPAGTSPNGLPMYWDHFDTIEAPEYLAKLEAEAAELSARLSKILEKIRKAYEAEQTTEETTETTEATETTEQPAEATESTQSDRARSAYLNTYDECEAIEATGTREAVHEAKKLRTLAAEALALFLRTRAPEWVEELETLQREAFEYRPDGLQDQRREAERIGHHPRE